MHNKKRLFKLVNLLLFILLAGLMLPVNAHAEEEYTEEYTEEFANYSLENDETGYYAWIYDEAKLFSVDESVSILNRLYDITEYGNAFVFTIPDNYTSTDDYADQILADPYYSGQNVSATLFLIDMDNRNIYIRNDGAIEKVITRGRSETITDNVYTYASDGDYYSCTYIALNQIMTLLEGGRIAQPMKYVSNFLLAILVALFINFFIVRGTSSVTKPSNKSVIEAAKTSMKVGKSSSVHVSTTRRYDPPSSGSGGSGGGGGSSSSGGGHSF